MSDQILQSQFNLLSISLSRSQFLSTFLYVFILKGINFAMLLVAGVLGDLILFQFLTPD